jgi:hypothetical protein
MATILPPPKYDVPPPMPVIEHVLSHDEVQRICNAKTGMVLSPPQFWAGCTNYNATACHVWYTGDAATLRHEKAHCAGWPNSHPGGW